MGVQDILAFEKKECLRFNSLISLVKVARVSGIGRNYSPAIKVKRTSRKFVRSSL
jgi:hypothetical protein